MLRVCPAWAGDNQRGGVVGVRKSECAGSSRTRGVECIWRGCIALRKPRKYTGLVRAHRTTVRLATITIDITMITPANATMVMTVPSLALRDVCWQRLASVSVLFALQACPPQNLCCQWKGRNRRKGYQSKSSTGVIVPTSYAYGSRA
eukprot:1195856-Prorocentrum_minimum.AAC.5